MSEKKIKLELEKVVKKVKIEWIAADPTVNELFVIMQRYVSAPARLPNNDEIDQEFPAPNVFSINTGCRSGAKWMRDNYLSNSIPFAKFCLQKAGIEFTDKYLEELRNIFNEEVGKKTN